MKKIIANRFRILSKIYSDETDMLYNVSDEMSDHCLKMLHMTTSYQVAVDTFQEKHPLNQKLKVLRHPNLIPVHHQGVTDEGFPYYCTAPFSKKANPIEHKKISSSTALELIFQLCHALSYLHRNGIIHGNLKPSHLFKVEDTLQIIGYGAALAFEKDETFTAYLSKKYSAPELFETYTFNPLTDLYSLGAIAFHLFTGAPPIQNSHAHKENETQLTQSLETQYQIPFSVKRVILRLLSKAPDERYQSAEKVLSAFNEVMGKPWIHLKDNFTKINREAVIPDLIWKDEIHELKEKIKDKTCDVIVISGESGTGKNILFQKTFHHLKRDNTLIVQSLCIKEEGIAYRPVREILRQLIPILLKKHQGRLPLEDQQCAVIATLIPELWDAPFMKEVPSPTALDHEGARHRMNHSLFHLLCSAARHSPLIIYIKDMQWSDEATLAFLPLLKTLPNPGTLTLCATDRKKRSDDIFAFKSKDIDYHLTLQTLSKKRSEALVSSLISTETIPSLFMDTLYTITGGNLCFILSMIRLMTEKGILLKPSIKGWIWVPEALKKETIPDQFKGVNQRLIQHLSETSRHILAVSSVTGSLFWERAIISLTDYSKDMVRLSLNEAMELGLITEYPIPSMEEGRKFIFSHHDIQKICYPMIPKEKQSFYHERFADWLKNRYRGKYDEQIGMIADHLERAGQKKEAMTSLMQAGGLAADQFANTQAIQYLDRAFRLTPKHALVERYAILRVREEVNSSRGDRNAQLKDIHALERNVRMLQDDHRKIEVINCKINYKILLSKYHSAIEDTKYMISLSDKLQDVRGLAEGYYRWGSIQWRLGEYKSSIKRLEKSIAISTSAGLYKSHINALRILGNVNWRMGQYSEALLVQKEALKLNEIHHTISKSRIIINIGLIYVTLGNYEKGDQYYEESLSIAQKTGDIELELGIYANKAELKILTEHFEEALTYAEKTYHLSLMTQHPLYQAYAMLSKGEAMHGLTRFEEADKALTSALQLFQNQSQHFEAVKTLTILSDIALKRRDEMRAHRLVEQVLTFEKKHTFIGTSYPYHVYLRLIQVLQEIKDERVNDVIISAHHLFQQQVRHIKNPDNRNSFLNNIPAHQKLQKIFSENIVLKNAIKTDHLEKKKKASFKKGPKNKVSKPFLQYKKVEAALSENEIWFRSIAENASEAIMIFDDKENILFWNTAAYKMFGYNSLNSRHQLFISLLAKNFRNTFQRETQMSQDPKKIESNEKSIVLTGTRKDGTEFPLEISLTPSKRNEQTLYTVIGRDITERKRVERALEESKQRAESTQNEMRQINERLESAMEKGKEMAIKAKAANYAKSEFLANMSHEIRTPMNAIIGLSHLSLGTDLNDEQQEYLSAIGTSAEKLLSIINDILDFSKIEAGHLDLEEIDFNLTRTMDEINDTLSVKVHEKGLELLSRIEPNVPLNLVGDPIRLHQILLNLGGNAVKFTKNGEIFISCSLIEVDQSKAVLQFSVKDSGIGIPEEKQSSIFESFKQAENSTTRQFGGTGLGLSISKQLVEKMGGKIWIESKMEMGCTFHFTIQTGLNHLIQNDPLNLKIPELKDKKVLIVDDNKNARTLMKEMLSPIGCGVNEASSGADALTALERAVYDVILMDAVMPDMDGIQTIEKIREDKRFKRCHIILLILMGLDGINEKVKNLDISSQILKPVKAPELLSRLKALFSQTEKCMDTAPSHIDAAPHQKSQQALKVLLVEDNLYNQMMASRLLEKSGHSVSIAGNGKIAIEKIQTETFDIVLMDVQMPEMDGFEATRNIRKLDSDLKDIPIIAMTAFAMKGDQERCIEAGMNDYIPKPIDPHLLEEMLFKVINDTGKRYHTI